MARQSNPERVVDVLRTGSRPALCDDCIAASAGITNRIAVNPIATALGLTSDFVRDKDTCSRCRKAKLVTRAVKG
ncbi:MAG: hypothetical protein KF838_04450 [Phycisphaeraceae bacterium]|nr:MAG: hypothetical protein KF838_04450 [Phycisphaeraceae bacterium]